MMGKSHLTSLHIVYRFFSNPKARPLVLPALLTVAGGTKERVTGQGSKSILLLTAFEYYLPLVVVAMLP